MAEDEIIDDYLGGKLSDTERASFETHFLATPERHEKLKFGRAFDRYLSSQVSEPPVQPLTPSRNQRGLEMLRSSQQGSPRSTYTRAFFSSPLRVAAVTLVVAGLAFGVWRVFFHQSDVDKGLLALNAAYLQQRPVEARISSFSYAPFSTTRGGPERVDSLARTRAEAILSNAVNDSPSAAAPHHALGKVYLANKKFDEAIKEFDEALKSDPKNAQLYSDLGAAWLEKGKIDRAGKQPGKGMEELGHSLENVSKALGLDSNLLEALFNRALCRQYMFLYQEAEEDWREYLKRDPTSAWADEARRNLKVHEEPKATTSSSKEQVLRDFFAAYELNDSEAAWTAIKGCRERKGNLIVETLLDDYLKSAASGRNEEANGKLLLLSYEGRIEEQKAGDQFTSDLVRFYRDATPTQRALSMQAREIVKSANSRYYVVEFEQALDLYSKAHELFISAGNECDALFAESWAGYCYLRIPNVKESLQTFAHLSKIFEEKSYRSLLAQSLNALSDAQLTVNEFSQALDYGNRSLELSRQIEDETNVTRTLGGVVSVQLNMGSYRESLGSVFQGLSAAETSAYDPTLVWRFHHEAALDYYFEGLPAAAIDSENEAARLADVSGISLLKARSLDRLALLYEQVHDYDRAITLLNQALNEAQGISGEASKGVTQVHTMLSLGQLYRESSNFPRALDYYDRTLDLSRKLNNLEFYLYQAHKGKLAALIGLGSNAAAETELVTVVSLFEKYRNKITEESYRDKFFDVGQPTYDLAVDFEYSKQSNFEKAFEYAEAYRARSLFNLITNSSRVFDNSVRPDVNSMSGTKPLDRSQIQNSIPDRAQILEYSVLDDKVLMWVVTRNALEHAETKITAPDLDGKIHRYLDALSRGQPGDAQDALGIAKELYADLIAPVESRGYLDPNLQLCIVPDKDLNFLPFAALASPSSGKYLLENYAIEIAPSATVFVAGSESAKQRERNVPERLLSVGNPLFDHGEFTNLPDLPAAEREAKQIATYYPPAVPLIEEAATLSKVREALPGADVVHFATHALPDEESPLLSKLLLSSGRSAATLADHSSPGFLQASEIYKMKLPRTRLVVLSACQSGIERTYRGEGAIGLARPFIAAGVPIVIASLWPVESNSTADLMISFHKHRKQDHVSTVEALRRAELEMLRSSQHGSPQSTYGWAAFTVIGGYAPF